MYQTVIPGYWGIKCYIINEFIGITRIQITQVLEKYANNANVAILMKALISTKKFEKEYEGILHREYGKYIDYVMWERDRHTKKDPKTTKTTS